MAYYITGLVILVFTLGICHSANYDQSKSDRMAGKKPKGCSEFGHPLQPAARVNTTLRLQQLREVMEDETVLKTTSIDAYLITSDDEHQSEYVAECDRRREYISGFSGSYGDAIVTMSKAVLWTDGRYHLQADDQLNCNWTLMRKGHRNVPTIYEWLKNEFPNGARIGADTKLISESMWKEFEYELINTQIKLIEIENNLIDVIWKDRPQKRNKDAFVLPLKYSGRLWTSKIADLRRELNKIDAKAMVVTALDEIAWLLNLRGRDIPYSPFLRSYLIVDMYEIRFFVNRSQLIENDTVRYFEATRNQTKDTVRIFGYSEICDNLRQWSQAYKILIPSSCVYSAGASHYIHDCVPKDKRLSKQSPVIFLKAKKNPTEIRGMRSAHIRDAAAMCEFFYYLETRFKSGDYLTELDLVKTMNEMRFEQKDALGNSFRTIAAFGANGAHPHYEPTNNTNAQIFDNSTLVLDSGGQYYDGTTDVTRTLHLGKPTKDQIQAYTRVLIGTIQLSTLTFPSNMKTSVADVMARAPLWEIGLDYLHGTSHGVGSFLSVHESPVSMYFNELATKSQLLKPGYFLSNEPGFYREGDFGIRLENVLEVIEKPWLKQPSGHSFYGFKVVTLVPYEPKLIDFSLLSVHHRRWYNSYNEQIRDLIGAELKRQNLMNEFYWMLNKTNNIPEYGKGTMVVIQPSLLIFCVIFLLFTEKMF